MSEKVWRVLEQGSDTYGAIGHGWTYSSHPHCAAAGMANLEVVDELDVVANAREVGAYFNQALNDAVGANRFVGEVRGEGLMAAVELCVTGTTGCFSTPPKSPVRALRRLSWSRASSVGPCRMAISSASRRRSA